MIKQLPFFLSIWFLLTTQAIAQADEERTWVPVAIHMATTVSDGSLTLDQIVRAARNKGVKALIITDRDFMKWEYGFWPFRRLFKKTVESNSVFKYGLDNYLKDIELESRNNPDMVIIPGLESAPFYYWKGTPFSGNLRICDWHKHLLIALPNPQDYRNMPVFLNRDQAILSKQSCDLASLWPFTTLIVGLVFLRRRSLSRFSERGRIAGALTIIISLMGIVNNFPYCRNTFDQYCIGIGERPYQEMIDYVVSKNGACFWAHPEAAIDTRRGGVEIQTQDQTQDMWDTTGYTGFSIFYEGYKRVGSVGGDWDGLLEEYAAGRRTGPVWVIAGLAFDNGTVEDFERLLDDLRVDVLTDDLTGAGIIDALKRGRAVVSRGAEPHRVILDGFSVSDSASKERAGLGETLVVQGLPVVEIKGRAEEDDAGVIEILLVKGGKILREFSVTSPYEIRYEDAASTAGKTYYRVEIHKGAQVLVTNPIFIQKNLV